MLIFINDDILDNRINDNINICIIIRKDVIDNSISMKNIRIYGMGFTKLIFNAFNKNIDSRFKENIGRICILIIRCKTFEVKVIILLLINVHLQNNNNGIILIEKNFKQIF